MPTRMFRFEYCKTSNPEQPENLAFVVGLNLEISCSLDNCVSFSFPGKIAKLGLARLDKRIIGSLGSLKTFFLSRWNKASTNLSEFESSRFNRPKMYLKAVLDLLSSSFLIICNNSIRIFNFGGGEVDWPNCRPEKK